MAKLTEPVKDYIVRELAAFSTPTEVAKSVKEMFGVEITRQQVYEYDPTHTRGAITKKRKALFEKARKAFLERTSDIPIAQKAFRLKRLSKLAEKAEEMGNVGMAASLYEQSAKEVGDVYTNRQKVEAHVNVHEAWLAKLPAAT